MNARFFAPGSYATGDVVPLPDDEAQHLTRVLRLKAGDHVRLFNGTGGEFDATIEQVSRAGAQVRVETPAPAAPEPRVAITLIQAVLKGDKMDAVVRDAVMLGVAAIQPVVTRRAETALTALRRSRRRERWTRIAVSSAKQCGRAVVPEIREPESLDALPAALAALRVPSPALMLVEPSAAVDVMTLHDLEPVAPREASVVVGPEGGWDPAELEQASSVCHLVRLGPRTLRADAMALVALSALFTYWNAF